MKTTRFLLSAFAVVLAATVTLGSMYVTIGAATTQEATPVVAQEQPAEPVAPVAAVEIAPAAGVTSIAPDEILHDRNHQIVLDEQGGFRGRFSTLKSPGGQLQGVAEMTVKVVHRNSVVASAKTNTNGEFQVSGLNEGVVGLLAFNSQTLLIYGVRLVQPDASTGTSNVVVSEFDLDSAAVSPVDVPTVVGLLFRDMPDKDVRFSGEPTQAETQDFRFGSGESSTSVINHTVRLEADGSLRGQVNIMDDRTGRFREVLDLKVHFVRDGRHVATADVDKSGRFVAIGLQPGVHSVVAGGRDGVAAFAINILGRMAPGVYQPASAEQQLNVAFSPVSPGNINRNNFSQLTDGTFDQTAPPGGATPPSGPAGGAPGGGGGATGGGGGGAGGGFGAIGALLGGAIGAGLGYAAADDNNSPASFSN